MEALFGTSLKDKTGGEVVTSSLCVEGGVVGIYFSAHWCPPCKQFTPILSDWYEMVKEKGDNMEIVFVSSDRDEAAFNSYYETMPWLCLPFDKRDIKAALSEKFGVRGIPSLIFVNSKTGEIITKEGRDMVMKGESIKA